MKSFIWSLASFVAFFSYSTSLDLSGLKKIRSKIKVEMTEQMSDSVPLLCLKSKTVNMQTCCNCKIIASHNITNNTIRIEYTDIYKPKMCLTALGPASTSYLFNLPIGIYQVEFYNDNILNTAKLTVDDKKYVLQVLSSENIMVVNDTLFRATQ